VKLTRDAYEELIAEDLAWLEKQPRTLERDHVMLIVKRSASVEYDLVDALDDVLGTTSDDPEMDAKYDRAEVLVMKAREDDRGREDR